MNVFRRSLTTFATLSLLASLFLPATAGTFGIDEKIALENSLSSKIEEVVVKMLGDKNIIVIVTIEHNTTIEQEVKKIETMMQSQSKSQKKVNYLPGIPMDALDAEIVTRQPDNSVFQTLKLPQFIKSISITLIVSDRIPNEKVERVRDYIIELLHLDFTRGDRIGIQKMSFAEDPKDRTSLLEKTLFSQLPWVIALILLMFFIFGPVRNFMRNIISTVEVFRIQADTRVTSRGNEGRPDLARHVGKRVEGVAAAGVAAVSSDRKTIADDRHHFDFIDEQNIRSLIYLLKEESPNVVAIVMIYLPKEYSTLVIEELPTALRIDTLKRMATIKQYKSEEIHAIEKTLKEKVDYLLGGPQSIAELINCYEPDVRDKILTDIEKNDPDSAREIRKVLITFEDLGKLKKEHLYEVYKIVGTRLLAAALKGSPEQLIKSIMDGLTPGARDMLKQEMDLIPATISPARVHQSKKDAILTMQKLENQGIIAIERNGL